jgi:hypothetical protein
MIRTMPSISTYFLLKLKLIKPIVKHVCAKDKLSAKYTSLRILLKLLAKCGPILGNVWVYPILRSVFLLFHETISLSNLKEVRK